MVKSSVLSAKTSTEVNSRTRWVVGATGTGGASDSLGVTGKIAVVADGNLVGIGRGSGLLAVEAGITAVVSITSLWSLTLAGLSASSSPSTCMYHR